MHEQSLADSLAEALVRATDYRRRLNAQHADTPRRSAFSITISREPGASGTAVAREVGQRLGWDVYDEELLTFIAREMGTQVDMLKLIDEKPMSFLEQSVISMASEYNLNHDSYMVHLVAAVRALGEKGSCVIVGRGASCMLHPATTLRVRLVADLPDRIATIKKQKGLSEREAAKWVERTLEDRHAFIKKYFARDVADVRLYDLVVNTSRWPLTDLAALIIDALGRLETRNAHAGAATS